MFPQPKLTVCVPSRNRQRYFQETIRSLLANMRTDVQFVFADNSDDPTIMNEFMKDVAGDPRVTFIASEEKIFSMVDNWERCLKVATGEFISVIGDDDYIDIDVIDLIARIRADEPQADIVAWSRIPYNWPDNRPHRSSVAVPMGATYHRIDRKLLSDNYYHWTRDSASPNNVFSIYHGAVSRRVMEKIRMKFNGRYFEHPVVDFENSCKLLTTAETFIYVERPMSVLGSCADSNSGRISTAADLKAMYDEFMADIGRSIDDDAYMKDFPFPLFLGNTAAIGLCQQWFKHTYGLKAPAGWEANFARACARNCAAARDRENFELLAAGYRQALENWHGGRYLAHFDPVYKERGASPFYGVSNGVQFIDEDIAGVRTPAELMHLAQHFLVPIAGLEYKPVLQKAIA